MKALVYGIIIVVTLKDFVLFYAVIRSKFDLNFQTQFVFEHGFGLKK